MLFLLKIEYLDPGALFSVEILRLHYLGHKFLKTMKYIPQEVAFFAATGYFMGSRNLATRLN